MNNIPKNCLDKFIATYKNFPSIIELVIDKEGVDKIVKNKTILWSYKKIIDGTIDIIDRETLLEIDANVKVRLEKSGISMDYSKASYAKEEKAKETN